MFVNLSILGLYQYDSSIFDGFNPPTGVDKDLCVNSILTECAELSLVYTDPETFKTLVSLWSTRSSLKWAKLYATTQLEYNPIHNYDRTEEWTENENENRKNDATQRITGDTTGTRNGENTEKVQGFNSNTFENRAQNSELSNDTTTSNTDGESETNEERTFDGSKTGRAFGNIGVTTTQQMIKAEREVVKFSIVDEIVSDFKTQFCIMVY